MKLSVYIERHDKACFGVLMFVFFAATVAGYLEFLAAALYALIAFSWAWSRLRGRSGGGRSTGSR